jgi:hypothetical protein
MEFEILKSNENYEESVNKLFSIEKELLSFRKKDMTTSEKVKSLFEELELYKFENDHLVCLMESKENEIKEARAILTENEKLLEKYRIRYSSALDKYEKMFSDLYIHLEKFPDPSCFNTLRGEIELVREENLDLIKKNVYLEEQGRQRTIVEENNSQGFVSYMTNLTERFEKINLKNFEEVLKSYQTVEGHIILLENEAIDWREKCEELDAKYNILMRDNLNLQKSNDEMKLAMAKNQALFDQEMELKKKSRGIEPEMEEQVVNEYMNRDRRARRIEAEKEIERKENGQNRQRTNSNSDNKNGKNNKKNEALALVICTGCGFNIKRNEQVQTCVQCCGFLIRKVSFRMLRRTRKLLDLYLVLTNEFI